MPWIRKNFTYSIPNVYYTDDFSEGKTKEFQYYGPEYITVHVEKDTGKEIGWCSYNPEELEVPVALDEKRIVLDCKEDPFVCELVNEKEDEHYQDWIDERAWTTLYEAPQGYQSLDLPADLHLRDIYDDSKVKFNFETNEFEAPVKTWSSEAGIDITKYTWEHFRIERNELLKSTDGILDEYMPTDLKNKWLEYKQLLRDAPENLSHIPPYFASMMFPLDPQADDPTTPGEDLFDQIRLSDDDQ